MMESLIILKSPALAISGSGSRLIAEKSSDRTRYWLGLAVPAWTSLPMARPYKQWSKRELTTDKTQTKRKKDKKNAIVINLEECIIDILVFYPMEVVKHTKRQGLAETAWT